ncbi:hypothetical protein [Belnapia rosea]|uniref:hypothetical protein n=1 Tax=Belnapia rosea TaxID=938405 RepID=UPI00088A0DB1|nr:hypothetical protein [Belnapia rosea]SDB73229.1 hypothetical protein SAMN02927895_04692 [Belnapia rosea]
MRSSDAAKLARILGLLGSDQAGERAAAGMAAHRLVTRLGLRWEDILGPPPESRPPPASPSHDALAAAQSRLRQSIRENADLRRQITRLQRRLEVLHQRQPPAAADAED